MAVRLGGGVCVVEEELRLAGEEDPPPPEPPSEEYTRLYNYSRGVNFNPVWGFTTPLILAVQQGNIDAVSLLLLFGEPVNDTVKGSPPPLYVAVETGERTHARTHTHTQNTQ